MGTEEDFVILGPATLLWNDIQNPDEKGRRGIKIGIPKNQKGAMDELREAIRAARGRLRGRARLPVKDGDEGHQSENGYWVMRAKTNYVPSCYDRNRARISDEQLYAGCKIRCKVKVYEYKHDSGDGVSLQLHWVQFVAHGDRLMGIEDDMPPDDLGPGENLMDSGAPSSASDPGEGYSDYTPDYDDAPW